RRRALASIAPMTRAKLVLLGVLVGAAVSSACWLLAAGGPRRLSIGRSIAVEFACKDPGAVLVQARRPGKTVLAHAYATLGTGNGADLFLPSDLDEALVILGIGGTLHDTTTGKEFTAARAGTWGAGRTDHKLEIRGAKPMAELQTIRGTRLTVSVANGVLVSSSAPIDER